jgi:hypothetical protein
MWILKEVPDDVAHSGITDEEVQLIYLLVAYSSHPDHRNITRKLESVVKTAKDNIESHGRWNNEGGNAQANNHH